MRHILILLTFTFLVSNLFSQGISFEEGNWKQILDKANAENKLIYLDAYASWCGPCKLMAKNVFTDQNVGAFFNENYINVSMDMEKDPNGKTLAGKFGLRAYPSHYIVNGQGDMVTMTLGYMEAASFLKWGMEAKEPENQLVNIRKKFAAGDRSESLIEKYLSFQTMVPDENKDLVIEQYFKSHPNVQSDQEVSYVLNFCLDPGSKNHSIFVDNRKFLQSKYGTTLLAMTADSYYKYGMTKGREYSAIENDLTALFPNDKGLVKFYLKRSDIKKRKDAAGNLANLKSLGDEYTKMQSDELNGIAWEVFETVADKDLIKQAILWAEASVKAAPAYANMDTLAWLKLKSGDTEGAKKIAAEAIRLGKESGQDVSSTEEILTK